MSNTPIELPWLITPRPQTTASQRLVCFPHAGGGPSAFLGWERVLPTEFELMVAQLPGRERRLREPHAPELGVIVRALADELEMVAQAGPYATFGHSFGALVAYEVVHELRARGCAEPSVMFSSGAVSPSVVERMPPCSQLPDAQLLAELNRRYGGIPSALYRDPELLAHFCAVLRADVALLEAYRFEERSKLSCPIVTLRGDRDAIATHDGVARWSEQTHALTVGHEFAGDHFFVRTAISEVSECISGYLRRYTRRGATSANIAGWVVHSAREQPDAIAVWGPDGPLSYRELDQEANRVARALAAVGVGRGDRVALWLEKSAHAVAIMQGTLRLGAAYIPLDPNSPAPRVQSILVDATPKVLFTDSVRAGKLQLHGAQPLVLRLDSERLHERGWAELDPAPNAHVATTQDELAYILYTSGSTGVPKGVCLSHGNARAFVEWAATLLRIGPTDALANHAPFHFDLSVFDLYGAFARGASVHLIPELMSYVPRHLVEFVRQRSITVLYAVPSVLRMMVDDGGLLEGVPELRHLIFAGEVYPLAALRKLREGLRDCRMFNFYGPTETNVCSYWEVESIAPERTTPVPIGGSASSAELWARGPDGETVALGGEGELIVDGPTVMLGYWGRGLQRGPYATGDQVRVLAAGVFEYVGRRDDLVKVRGLRIEPGEIEACLCALAGVREATVIVRGKELGARLVAFLVAEGPTMPSLLDVKRHCAERLPRPMIPDEVVWLRELPRTPNGKCDRQSLARVAREGRVQP